MFIAKNENPEVLGSDVTMRTPSLVEAVDILLSGFPCQPFSSAGKGQGTADPRDLLVNATLDYAAYHKPRLVILENVKAILAKEHLGLLEYVEDRVRTLGYVVHREVMHTRHNGVPQNRPRVYVVYIRADVQGDRAFTFPEPIPPMKLRGY